jgi:hypothetical protein
MADKEDKIVEPEVIQIKQRKISSTDIIKKNSETHIAITSEPEQEFPEDQLAKEAFKFNYRGFVIIYS